MRDYIENGANILAQHGVLKDDVLMHHGIIGQRKGRRRWQYKDGSLTPEGYIHYGYGLPDKDKERDYWKGLPDKSSGRYSSGSTGGRQTHDDDYYERYSGDVEGNPESRNYEQSRQYDDIDADYREYDDEPPKQNNQNNGGGQKPPGGNGGSNNQGNTSGEGDKSQQQKLKKWKDMSGSEKATMVGVIARDVGRNEELNKSLKIFADKNRKKKQNRARELNAVGIENLSIDQMKAVIDRKDWERKYLDATTPQVQSGYDKTMEILGVVGSVGGLTVTALEIGNLIKQMK